MFGCCWFVFNFTDGCLVVWLCSCVCLLLFCCCFVVLFVGLLFGVVAGGLFGWFCCALGFVWVVVCDVCCFAFGLVFAVDG